MTLVIALSLTQLSDSGAAAPVSSERATSRLSTTADGGATSGGNGARPAKTPTRSEKCSAHRAVRFYARRIAEHRAQMGAVRGAPIARAGSCPRYLAAVLQRKARAWRLRAERHMTLRDFDVRPGYSGWRMAVDEVQRAFPGTRAWLLSCSASEGGWGRWVWNTQGSGCGGWLQFMHPTFVGFSARAISDVRRRGFRVPRSASSWLSPLGQALAGAWAYTNGLSFHWYGRGC